MKKIFNRRGLTLIEVIVVAAMVAMVGFGAFKALVSGTTLWKRLSSSRFDSEFEIYYSRLSRDLKNSCVFSEFTFTGSTGKLSFFVHDTAYTLYSSSELISSGKVTGKVIRRVEYEFDKEKHSIYRREYLIGSKAILSESRLLSSISKSTFSYFIHDAGTRKVVPASNINEQIPYGVQQSITYCEKNGKEVTKARTIEVPLGL